MMVIFNYFSGNSCNSVSLSLFSGVFFLFISLGVVSFFLDVLCNFLLRFLHLKMQPSLWVFAHWLHTGKDPQPSAWPEILRVSETCFCRQYDFFGPVCAIPQSLISFWGACNLFLPLLSMTLQILKFYRSKLPSSPLFSVATKHSEYISSLSVSQVRYQSHTQPSEKTEHWTHVLILSLPLEREASSCAFSLDHVLMC